MSAAGGGDIKARAEAVRSRVDIVAVVGAAVKLSRGSRPRGKCPFHGSKSDSLAVYPDAGRWKCWGCEAGGDAIAFVQDFYGLDFMGALTRLEGDAGIDPDLADPVRREKVRRAWRGPETVDSAVVARHLRSISRPDPEALRVWLRARAVPEAMLDEFWLSQLRFAPEAPIAPWPLEIHGRPGSARDVAQAPAMVGIIRRVMVRDGQSLWQACGVHATYLSPGLRAKMNRKRANGDAVPARKMYGASAGGAVLIGPYRPEAPLFVGEGIETVLSGMGMAGVGREACGLAVLSLENLQGGTMLRRGGALPLWDVRPDPERPGVVFAHEGPVTGLIDADMKPLRGRLLRDGETLRQAQGERIHAGMPVQEREGGPVVWRTVSTAERAQICADLFVKRWRAAGCAKVTAIRPPMGQDFNDMARSFDRARDERRA